MQHGVHAPGRDGALRHPGIFGLVRVLRDDQAAVFLHCLQPQAAIRAGARQDHASGKPPAIGGQRIQQKIEGQPGAMARQGL